VRIYNTAVDVSFKQRRARIGLLTLALAGLFALTAVRLAVIVLVDGPRLVSLGRNEHNAESELAAVRGPIVDRNGKPLALSAETRSVYGRPQILLTASAPADRARLAGMLGVDAIELESRLVNRTAFVWLARHLAPSRARAIEQLGLKGVGVVSEYQRFYPESNLAAAVVGVAGTDGQGLSGVELQYDRLVHGAPVGMHFYQDALGHPILDSPLQLTAPKPGARLQLTIDSSIQAEAENYLTDQVMQSDATEGTAVILDPFTGEVLALATSGRSGPGDRLHDSAVQDVFEPGSTIKGLLGAIALEDRVINMSREIYCEQGEWQVAGTAIHDDDRHGWLTLSWIIEVSSNIGAAKLALALGRRRFYQGIAAFGVGRKTGIDLPGETSGMVRPPSSWHQIDLANHGFGQGLAVTPVQLATAYAAIANGGLLMRPYVVKAAYDADGREVLIHTPQVRGRVIRPAVAHAINQVLRGVVNGREGTAHLAQVADFTVAGKTGTAQVVDPVTRTYYRDRVVASFVGFVPAEDPKLVILVVLYDVPRGHFGGMVAAPVFSEIASGALQRLAVAPAYSSAGRADLLAMGNQRFFSSSEDKDDDSGVAAIDATQPGFAPPAPARSANNESRRDDLRIPDFRGLSLRTALSVARNYQLALKVKGDGYVVSQEPAPGVPTRMPNLAPKQVQVLLAPPDGQPESPFPLQNSLAAMTPAPGGSSLVAASDDSASARHGKSHCLEGSVVGRGAGFRACRYLAR
jgi:cell division protein FtsI (penicillin-binding protein 3)